MQNKAITKELDGINEKLLYLGVVEILDSELGTVAERNKVPDGKPYIFTCVPISSDFYVQEGVSHVVIGMEYGNHLYGVQVSIASNGIKLRALRSGIWGDWGKLQ